MNERFQIAIKLIASHIILIVCLILFSIASTNDKYLSVSISQTALIILFLSGYWEFFGIRFRKLFCSVIQMLIIAVFVWRVQHDRSDAMNLRLVLCLSVVQAYLLVELIKIMIVIWKRDKVFQEILFPFKSGLYLITDGGNSKISRFMNYHYYSPTHRKNNTNNSMLYATDIVKLATEKTAFLPATNDKYLIFGEEIVSPLDGTVVKVENNIPDNDTFSGNYPYNTGNTIVIQQGNYFLLMGHLKQGSIKVREGDFVQRNDLLGLVGNSGWTERPHLHMQLIESSLSNYWSGRGVCMRYKNTNLYKNRLIKV
jgi:hypothetical protein